MQQEEEEKKIVFPWTIFDSKSLIVKGKSYERNERVYW